METNFSNLLIASQPQFSPGRVKNLKNSGFALAGPDGANLVEGSTSHASVISSIQDMMKAIGNSMDQAEHAALGAAVREPIRTLARYKAWTNMFFVEDPRGIADDNRIPVDTPIGKAFATSPEGRAQLIRLGVQQWVRPTFTMLSTGLEVPWDVLKTAGWAVLTRRMEETADDLARKIDTKAKTVLTAALLSGQTVSSSGSLLKSAVDYIIIQSTLQKFPVTQAAINSARIMDMTQWVFGSSSGFPVVFNTNQSKADELFTKLYMNGYGGIDWVLSPDVPYSEIWFSGPPSELGYHQTHGPAESASQVDVMRRVDQHITYQNDAWYIGNSYNLWKINIT